jgi:hypothetical protein
LKNTAAYIILLLFLILCACSKPKKGTYDAFFDFYSTPAPGYVYHCTHHLTVEITKSTKDSIFFNYNDVLFNYSVLGKDKKNISGNYYSNLGFNHDYFVFHPLKMEGKWRTDDGVYYIEGNFTTIHNAISSGTLGPDVADTGTFVFQRTGK